jgi:hypothetical protein
MWESLRSGRLETFIYIFICRKRRKMLSVYSCLLRGHRASKTAVPYWRIETELKHVHNVQQGYVLHASNLLPCAYRRLALLCPNLQPPASSTIASLLTCRRSTKRWWKSISTALIQCTIDTAVYKHNRKPAAIVLLACFFCLSRCF